MENPRNELIRFRIQCIIPVYHWTNMELKHPFVISDLLNADSADAIYNNASAALSSGELSVHN
jgi:glucuronate isomerase